MKPAALFLGLILAVAGCAQFDAGKRSLYADRAVRGRLGARERREQRERNRADQGRQHES